MQMLPVMLLPNKKYTKVLLATFVFQKASCIASKKTAMKWSGI